MKFAITFKSPDAFDYAITEAVKEYEKSRELTEEQFDEADEYLREFASKWVEWSEYITIEFDTELGTATVVKLRS